MLKNSKDRAGLRLQLNPPRYSQQTRFFLRKKKKLREVEKEQYRQQIKPLTCGHRPSNSISIIKPDNAALMLMFPSFSCLFVFNFVFWSFSTFPIAFPLMFPAVGASFSCVCHGCIRKPFYIMKCKG